MLGLMCPDVEEELVSKRLDKKHNTVNMQRVVSYSWGSVKHPTNSGMGTRNGDRAKWAFICSTWFKYLVIVFGSAIWTIVRCMIAPRKRMPWMKQSLLFRVK